MNECMCKLIYACNIPLIICFKNDTFTADSLNTVSSCCDADTLSRFRSHIPHTQVSRVIEDVVAVSQRSAARSGFSGRIREEQAALQAQLKKERFMWQQTEKPEGAHPVGLKLAK